MASSRERLLLDTNVLTDLIGGRLSDAAAKRISSTGWFGISLITRMEFLAQKDLPETDRNTFHHLAERMREIEIRRTSLALLNSVAEIRIRFNLKLPDSIIAASAKVHKATLLTRDTDFDRLVRAEYLLVERV